MDPLSRLATIAIVSATTVRGALTLTLEGMWADFALGLFWWTAIGGVMVALLAGGAWWLTGWRPKTPVSPHAETQSIAGEIGATGPGHTPVILRG